jgi:hypothetical protein
MIEMPGGITYSHKLATDICRKIASGKSLRKICKPKTMPDKDTVIGWSFGATRESLEDNFPEMYRLARKAQAEYYYDQCVDIADNAKDTQKARLQIDIRKWAAGKMRPKVYGDKINMEHSGGITLTHEQALEELDD